MTRYRFRFPATVAPLSAKSPSATPGFWRGPPGAPTREDILIPSSISGVFGSFHATPRIAGQAPSFGGYRRAASASLTSAAVTGRVSTGCEGTFLGFEGVGRRFEWPWLQPIKRQLDTGLC
jgi:hypothetical protein